jgi:xanthine dehydrogenase accessory factor
MDQSDGVLATAQIWSSEGRRLALATVVETWGSSPRPIGSQLLVDEHGQFTGSVSGGCVETEVVRAARRVISGEDATLLEFGVSDERAWSVGLACGGTIRVWVAPCPPAELLDEVATLRHAKAKALLSMSLDNGETQLASTIEQLPEALRQSAAEAWRKDCSRYVEIDGQRCFLQILSQPLRLLVVGAVHIAQALIPMAVTAGYQVTLIDPRRAFASAERFPEVELRHQWPDKALADLRPDQRTAIAVLTHDPKLDEPALAAALASEAFYVGVLGSRRTLVKRLAALRERGCTEDVLARVHGPIGLDIGAATPAEIAVAILAEMTGVLRRERFRRAAEPI